jgi:putative radical SAM enzyme (TIGR03279 family)
MQHIVASVEEGSIAKKAGILPGDAILSINGQDVLDIFDYRYLTQERRLSISLKGASGDTRLLSLKKREYDDLGIGFESGLMDEAKRCSNNCVFCFVDQLPRGMRDTLYFKDDDTRLSFLSGNYVTLTNMSQKDLERICFYHLSPINISVHAADPEVRKFMLRNSKAGDLLGKIKMLAENGTTMNFQIVLCKGINDGAQLDFTIETLASFIPQAESLSVVPVGLSRHRQALFPLEGFGKDSSIEVIEQVSAWQEKLLESSQTRFVYLADEFYLAAGIPVPAYSEYEGFPQLENGVGMLSLFERECSKEIEKSKKRNLIISPRRISVATGMAAGDFIRRQADKIELAFPKIRIDVHKVDNRFFGQGVTVAGLLTGQDILAALSGKDLGSELLIPSSALRDQAFLDDETLSGLGEKLGINARETEADGKAFVKSILRGDGSHG